MVVTSMTGFGIVAFILIGLVGLKLVAVIMNALVGHPSPRHPVPAVAKRRGLLGPLMVSGVLVVLCVGLASAAWVRTQHVVKEEHARRDEQRRIDEVHRELRQAVDEATLNLPSDVVEAIQEAGGNISSTGDGRVLVQAGPVTVTVDSHSDSVPGEATIVSEVQPPETTEQPPVSTSEPAEASAESNAVVNAATPASEPTQTVTPDESTAKVTQSAEVPAETAQAPVQEPAEATVTDSVTEPGNGVPVGIVERERVKEMVESIGGMLLRMNSPMSTDTIAKSANGEVVVMQFPGELASSLIGDEALRKLQSEIPVGVQTTYAIIPITAPTAPVNSVSTKGLGAVADALVQLLAPTASEPAPEVPEPVVAELSQPLEAPVPAWVRNREGVLVVETEALPKGADAGPQLSDAVESLIRELATKSGDGQNTALAREASSVRLSVNASSAEKLIRERYVRTEMLETPEGPVPMFKTYALVELNDDARREIDSALVEGIRMQRMSEMGLVLAMFWSSITAGGLGVRLWRSGRGFRRVLSVPMIVVAIPLLLAGVGIAVALSQGKAPNPPWSNQLPPVEVQI